MLRRVSLVLGLCCGAVTAWAAAPAPWRFVTESFPPYTYAENGRPAGPMVDILQELCSALKRECMIELLPWRRALAMAERGEVDGIFAFVDSPERRAQFHISAPVLDAHYTFFTRAGEDFVYRDRQSLAGRTVAVYGPSGASILLRELTEGLAVETVVEPDNPTVMRKLVAGRYGDKGLALMNENLALWLMSSERSTPLQAAGLAKSFSYSFGLSRKRISKAQFQAFDAALLGLCRSGRSAELIRRHALPASSCVGKLKR